MLITLTLLYVAWQVRQLRLRPRYLSEYERKPMRCCVGHRQQLLGAVGIHQLRQGPQPLDQFVRVQQVLTSGVGKQIWQQTR